jgi:hypothetical protein
VSLGVYGRESRGIFKYDRETAKRERERRDTKKERE